METALGNRIATESTIMPCHNQQLKSASQPDSEHAYKQVRFAHNAADGEARDRGVDGVNGEPCEWQLGPQVKLLPLNDQIRELQTIIRDKATSRGDFVFCADRLIRLVVEEGLNQLPYSECTVTTPTGHKYDGVKFEKGNCGVSIMRSGEAMEQGLRDCCRSIRIGKILIQSDEETQKAKVYYAKFPPDIYRRKVLLMYPILSTGNTVIEAARVLIEHGLQPKHIILLSLFSTPHGAASIVQEFPDITILTTEVHPVAPTHFGQKYFGTD
ncbi:uracil phosphoribosyltransferase-like [Scleropages formosus]|uniref:Uracil phosphoribosyltransferase homolog n=1 Tax=Scleropages formosus TaxID=113540 RepID=A0A0P7V311_SCLFO|nr:uracil phosphoribosyltransferase homolog [Scleropages formosus]XP_029112960.1 uracil phosphoribosyltransferase homolog [Scleropages formosus]KPP69015.1 uracil phosphoribosyltransferase-like [Scleropages formosus]